MRTVNFPKVIRTHMYPNLCHVSNFATSKAHVSKHILSHKSSTYTCNRMRDYVAFYPMPSTILFDYVTVQKWKLDHSTVSPVKMLYSIVHIYDSTSAIDGTLLIIRRILILYAGFSASSVSMSVSDSSHADSHAVAIYLAGFSTPAQ